MIIKFSIVEPMYNKGVKERIRIQYKNIWYNNLNSLVCLHLDTKIVHEKKLDDYGLYYYMGTITVDLTNIPRAVFTDRADRMEKILYINEEAEIFLENESPNSGGYRVDVFIGEDKVEILRQRYFVRRWRY